MDFNVTKRYEGVKEMVQNSVKDGIALTECELGAPTLDELLPNSSLVRIPEAAQILALSRSKLYLMMDAGDLPYVKFGKSRRILRTELQKLVERNLVTGR
jgi:excisionase family DNA binding protein